MQITSKPALKSEVSDPVFLMNNYLVLSIGSSLYALPSFLVDEITFLPEITTFLDAPNDILGLIVWRSKVISVIDLRKRLNVAYHYTVQDSLIIIKSVDGHVGLVVDRVVETIEDAEETTVQAVEILNPPFSKMIHRVLRHDHQLIGLLSIESIVACPEEINLFLENSSAYAIGDFYDRFMPNADAQIREKLSSRAKNLAVDVAVDSSLLAKGRNQMSAAMVEINGSLWAINLLWIKEFIVLDGCQRLSFASLPVIGVYNLRGEIVPLLNLGCQFNDKDKIFLVALEKDGQVLGLSVERIYDLIDYSVQEIDKGDTTRYSMGSIVYADKVVKVLDFSQLLVRV